MCAPSSCRGRQSTAAFQSSQYFRKFARPTAEAQPGRSANRPARSRSPGCRARCLASADTTFSRIARGQSLRPSWSKPQPVRPQPLCCLPAAGRLAPYELGEFPRPMPPRLCLSASLTNCPLSTERVFNSPPFQIGSVVARFFSRRRFQTCAIATALSRSATPDLTVALLDCVDQLRLVHRGPTRYAEPAGNVEQVLLAGVGVDAFGGRDRVV